MYRLRIEEHFDAAHKLIGYQGKCAQLHGHTWKVEIFVTGKDLNNIGFVIDFNLLKREISKTIERLDHKLLNDIKEIGNPTCENISRYLFNTLKGKQKTIKLEKIRVWEGEKSWCEYYEE